MTISLTSHQHLQQVQNLSFCYICGLDFKPDDSKNRDHIPAQSVFPKSDRNPPLWLPTHVMCNKSHERVDEKIGQLIALRYGRVPTRIEHRRLRFVTSPDRRLGAVANIDVRDAVWRWIAGFHSALYREPAIGIRGSLVTPFPAAHQMRGQIVFEPIRPQHQLFVDTIRLNRARGNLDTIKSNNGKLTYECVWLRADNHGPWMCVFALDVCDWKDLGRTPLQPSRGCAGFYLHPSMAAPNGAATTMPSRLVVPNSDPLDPFARS